MNRNIIHLHIPSFSITLERVSCPELRDRPVAVAPLHSDRALILSVSTEARREGVFKGMALGKAVKFCPDLIVLPPNPALTEKGCRVLAKAISRYTPLWEPAKPGHVYMDVTGTERLWGRAKDTAYRISREIKGDLSLVGAVGVAGNKMISSIASRVMPSEGVLDVGHGKEAAFIAPLRVDYLPGIGHVRQRTLLEELNISLIREIAILDVCNLRLVFGRQAIVIHQRALGIDPTPVHPPAIKPSVSESITLPRDENDDRKLLGVLYVLVEKCSQRLRKRGILPRKAGLILRYSDQTEVSRQVSLPTGSFWEFDLYAPLVQLFFKTCQRRVGVRFLRVWFRELMPVPAQLSLFSQEQPLVKKNVEVIRALDNIRKRHGDKVIKFGKAGLI